MTNAASLGALLRHYRLFRGFTQQQVATHLGVTFQAVQRYEKGLCRVPVDALKKMSDLFGVPVASLLEGTSAGGLELGQEALEAARYVQGIHSEKVRKGVLTLLRALT